MSKQFRFYLLPSDAVRLLSLLNEKVGVKIYAEQSATSSPHELSMTVVAKDLAEADHPANICLAGLLNARVASNFYPTRDLWIIDTSSECIEFSPCKLEGNTLVQGRFYFQNDMLIDGTIWKKRDCFLQWADRCFSLAKRSLMYSRDMEAYIGADALLWQRNGGTFTQISIVGRTLIQ